MTFTIKSRVDQIRGMLAIIQSKILCLPPHIKKLKNENIQNCIFASAE
jgi:hypothetical protein